MGCMDLKALGMTVQYVKQLDIAGAKITILKCSPGLYFSRLIASKSAWEYRVLTEFT